MIKFIVQGLMEYLLKSSRYANLITRSSRSATITKLYRQLLKNSWRLNKYDAITAKMIRVEIKLEFCKNKELSNLDSIIKEYKKGLESSDTLKKAVVYRDKNALKELDGLAYGQSGVNKFLFIEAYAAQTHQDMGQFVKQKTYDIPIPVEFQKFLLNKNKSEKLRALRKPFRLSNVFSKESEEQGIDRTVAFYKLKTAKRY